MERRTAYRHRVTREERYRRARLVETARVTRYRAEHPDPTAVASYEDAPRPVAQPYDEATGSAAGAQRETWPESSSQPAEDAATPADREPLSQAAEDSAPDTGSQAAETHSQDEVASLAIPRGAMPPPLKGSLASLERQNERLTAEGLERIENEDDLAARIANHLLVPVPASSALTVNPSLPENHRYCRPWTARFLADLARQHEAIFHRPLEVSSAVRTVEYQKRLMEINGNAAPAEGDIVSPHLTGATIDIAKEGLSRDEMKWMRNRLLQLQNEGKIDVEEEFQQACFHITVYKSYAPARPTRRVAHPRPEYIPQEPAEQPGGDDTEGL